MTTEVIYMEPIPPDLTIRERLLIAAEREVATRGVSAMSIRRVNEAAGASSAAAHYHFGNKQAIIAEVLQTRMAPLMKARLAMLAEVRAQRKPTTDDIARILVQPLVDLRGRPEGQVWISFLSALDHAGQPWVMMSTSIYNSQAEPIWTALSEAFPDLRPVQCKLRWRAAGSFVAAALADPATYWTDEVPDWEEIELELRVVATGVLASRPTDWPVA